MTVAGETMASAFVVHPQEAVSPEMRYRFKQNSILFTINPDVKKMLDNTVKSG
jgi:hypothetical protein